MRPGALCGGRCSALYLTLGTPRRCGHCKNLAPIYEELGEAFADNDNVVIAKMDGTANEVDGLAVSGFPTLKYFAPNAKSANDGIAYSGGRELDDFVTFIEGKVGSGGHDEL